MQGCWHVSPGCAASRVSSAQSAQCRLAPACASCQLSQARCEAVGSVPRAGTRRKAPPGARRSSKATSSASTWLTSLDVRAVRDAETSGTSGDGCRRRRFGEDGLASRLSWLHPRLLVFPGPLGGFVLSLTCGGRRPTPALEGKQKVFR